MSEDAGLGPWFGRFDLLAQHLKSQPLLLGDRQLVAGHRKRHCCSATWPPVCKPWPRQSMAFAPKVRFAPDSPLEGAGFELSVPRQMDLCKHGESPRIATPGAQIGGELMKMDPTASLAYPASMRGGRPAAGKPGAS